LFDILVTSHHGHKVEKTKRIIKLIIIHDLRPDSDDNHELGAGRGSSRSTRFDQACVRRTTWHDVLMCGVPAGFDTSGRRRTVRSPMMTRTVAHYAGCALRSQRVTEPRHRTGSTERNTDRPTSRQWRLGRPAEQPNAAAGVKLDIKSSGTAVVSAAMR
jgi:hypothetical protein